MNDTIENPNDGWVACPPGELHRLVRGVRLHHRARAMRRTALTFAAAAVVAVAAWITVSQVWQPPETANHGPYIAGVCCDDVRRELPDLIAMRLDPERAAQLHRHLDDCPDCRHVMQQIQDQPPLSFDHQPGHAHRAIALTNWRLTGSR
jgi:hypothetical protein